jgi:hypothetical protein
LQISPIVWCLPLAVDEASAVYPALSNILPTPPIFIMRCVFNFPIKFDNYGRLWMISY